MAGMPVYERCPNCSFSGYNEPRDKVAILDLSRLEEAKAEFAKKGQDIHVTFFGVNVGRCENQHLSCARCQMGKEPQPTVRYYCPKCGKPALEIVGVILPKFKI